MGYHERFVTLKKIGLAVGLPYFNLRRAAKVGLFPTCTLLNSCRLARLTGGQAALRLGVTASPTYVPLQGSRANAANSKLSVLQARVFLQSIQHNAAGQAAGPAPIMFDGVPNREPQ